MKKIVYLVGIGAGGRGSMTGEAIQAVADSECVIGAGRMLSALSDLLYDKKKLELVRGEEIAQAIGQEEKALIFSVVLSGDPGFYSGGKKLLALLARQDCEIRVVSGVSSLSYFMSRLAMSWEGVAIQSAHGRDTPLAGAVMRNEKTFVLTGGERRVEALCQELTEKGLGHVTVYVGERLSYPEERIVTATAAQLSHERFDSLSVMLAVNPHPIARHYATHGLPDEMFVRGEVPMTKSEVRSVCLAKLQLLEQGIAYDIGAGTGSVSVEMALRMTGGTVYAIEKDARALELLQKNKERFRLANLEIVPGTAPEAFDGLPAASHVFIGGSSGNLRAILEAVQKKNPAARIVANAIALETASEALQAFEELGMQDVEAVQVAVAKAKKAGRYHMMMGQNPVYVISGQGTSEQRVLGELGASEGPAAAEASQAESEEAGK